MENSIINILLLDDDEDEYVILKDLLKEINQNYQIYWANNYNQAIKEIKALKYDICLADYSLGNLNGVDFIKEIVNSGCNTPIILLTGYGDHKVDLSAMKSGASDYLDKNNIDLNTLERSIRYALERKKSDEKIKFLAYYDQLTRLPNRTLFYNRLNMAFAMAKRHKRILAILFLDIDNFKRVNDSLGHNSGDILIKEVGNRLLNCIRKEDMITDNKPIQSFDTVARLGGDEFTILLSEINKPENASKVADRIYNVLKEPIILGDKKINITVSIGISIFPFDGQEIEILIKNADLAMYNAKNSGKNNFKYYNNLMHSVAINRLNLEHDLNNALNKNELELYYQPIFSFKNKNIINYEALLRWNHPKNGIIFPNDFIPIAEETGFIIKLNSFIFNKIGNLYKKVLSTNNSAPNFSINISPKQLNHKDFIETVKNFLTQYEIGKQKITFEITEHSIIDNWDNVNNKIKPLKDLGIKIALDDFGTGYSSFVTLKKINFDIVKIDESFIRNLFKNKQNSKILYNLIEIIHCLDSILVAEGIETSEEYNFLVNSKCDLGQGYYLCKPLPQDQFLNYLSQKNILVK